MDLITESLYLRFHALDGLCDLFAEQDRCADLLEHGAWYQRRDRAVRDQTRDHPLPRREAPAGRERVALQPVTGMCHVERPNRRGLRRAPAHIAGLTEYAMQRVLRDRQRMQRDDTGLLLQILVHILDVDEVRTRIDERTVAGPTGAGIAGVSTFAFAALHDEVGIDRRKFLAVVVDILLLGTQILVDAHDEMLEEGIAKARRIIKRSDIALIVCPLAHREADQIPAVDTELVDEICQRNIGIRAWVAGDHDERPVIIVGFLDMRKHIRDLIGVDALGNDDLRLGIRIRRKKILRLHRAQARHHFRVKI